jgi:hypothetical protein
LADGYGEPARDVGGVHRHIRHPAEAIDSLHDRLARGQRIVRQGSCEAIVIGLRIGATIQRQRGRGRQAEFIVGIGPVDAVAVHRQRIVVVVIADTSPINALSANEVAIAINTIKLKVFDYELVLQRNVFFFFFRIRMIYVNAIPSESKIIDY